jgi:hypothetical protein
MEVECKNTGSDSGTTSILLEPPEIFCLPSGTYEELPEGLSSQNSSGKSCLQIQSLLTQSMLGTFHPTVYPLPSPS